MKPVGHGSSPSLPLLQAHLHWAFVEAERQHLGAIPHDVRSARFRAQTPAKRLCSADFHAHLGPVTSHTYDDWRHILSVVGAVPQLLLSCPTTVLCRVKWSLACFSRQRNGMSGSFRINKQQSLLLRKAWSTLDKYNCGFVDVVALLAYNCP